MIESCFVVGRGGLSGAAGVGGLAGAAGVGGLSGAAGVGGLSGAAGVGGFGQRIARNFNALLDACGDGD